MATWRKLSGLIAALILAGMGGLLVSLHPFLGGTFAIMGLGLAAWQGWALWRNRAPDQDPYDLNSLWDTTELEETDEPDDDIFVRDGSALLCRHCGEAIGGGLRVCPHCKNLL
jgi:hypothetical protein